MQIYYINDAMHAYISGGELQQGGGKSSRSIHFLKIIRKEENVLFNGALNTFYLWLYGMQHMDKDH